MVEMEMVITLIKEAAVAAANMHTVFTVAWVPFQGSKVQLLT